MVRKIVIAGVLAIASIAGIGISQAGAAAYNACPGAGGWWIHNQGGGGTVMQCVVDNGNHVVIRQWIGGVDGGVVYEAYHPGWMHWYEWADPDGYGPNIGGLGPFCAYGANLNRVASPWGGWESSFKNMSSGVTEGVFNHFLGWAGIQPYGAVTHVGCPSGHIGAFLQPG